MKIMAFDKTVRKLLLIEIVVLCVIVISMIGKRKVYDFNTENIEIYHENVIYVEAEDAYYISPDTELATGYPVLGNAKMRIAPGAYDVEIQYASIMDLEDTVGSCVDKAGWLQIRSYKNPTSVKYNTIDLVGGQTIQKDRMWITSVTSIEDLDFKIYYEGRGILKIEKIIVRELLRWRVIRILSWLLGFLFIDFCYLYFIRKNTYQNKHVYQSKHIVLGFFVMTFLANLPVFQGFVIGGHDAPFHLARILSLGRAIEEGRWIAPIQTDMMNGYGYATPLFYGQLFLYFPALLYNMAVPIHTCYQVYVFCINVITSVICYFCFKGICKNRNIAFIGTWIYVFSAYRISNVYVRAAVGEYTAMAFMPMVVYGFYKIYMTEQKKISIKDYIIVVLGLTGMIQSHLLSTEIMGLFIIITCVILLKKTFQLYRFIALVKAALLTVLLNLGFLIPMLDSMKMDILVKTTNSGHIQESGAYLLQLFGMFMTPSGKSLEEIQGDMPINLGLGLAVGIGIFFWCYVKRFDWGMEGNKLMRSGAIFTLLAGLAIVFSLQIFPWDSLWAVGENIVKLATVIQFPWRYLSVATVLCAFVSVIGISICCESGRVHYGIFAGGIICFLLVLNVGFFYMQYADISITTKMYASMSNLDSITNIYGGEYLLEGTETELCARRDIIVEEDTVQVTDYVSQGGKVSFLCLNNSSEPKHVEIPLFCYENYQAYDQQSGSRLPIEIGQNNRISIEVPENYSGNICVKYVIPVLWKIAYVISVLTGIGIIGIYFDSQKGRRIINEGKND